MTYVITGIYLLLVAIILVMVGWNMLESKKITDKIAAGVVIVLLVLRLFLIK